MKKIVSGLLACAFVMLALPWLAVSLIKGDGGMAACFVLFFAVDPLFSAALGIWAGKELKSRCFFPLVAAGLFLAGTWLLFDPGETAFLLYAGIYLALGAAAMLLSAAVRRERKP